MKPVKLGEITIPVSSDNIVELVNYERKLRGQKLLPEEITQDNLKISFNSEEYREDLINISFLGHLRYDILIPYPSNAWMESALPEDTFTEVHCAGYYQKINGDCELTHAIEDLQRILKPNGIAYVGVPNFKLILNELANSRSEAQRLRWEHFLFSRNVDEKGLFYNQSICDATRIMSRARFAGFKSAEEDADYGTELEKYLTMTPENFNLQGVNKEVRQKFKEMLRDDDIRRKKCIIARCSSKAGQQEFKRVQSIYCRRHFRKAKGKLKAAQERALRVLIVLKKEQKNG